MGAWGTLTIDSRSEALNLLNKWNAQYDTNVSNEELEDLLYEYQPNNEGYNYHIQCTEQVKQWNDINELLPEKSGRYWCYVKELNDLGTSYYQWNYSYNNTTKTFNIDGCGGHVTHWTTLMDTPI